MRPLYNLITWLIILLVVRKKPEAATTPPPAYYYPTSITYTTTSGTPATNCICTTKTVTISASSTATTISISTTTSTSASTAPTASSSTTTSTSPSTVTAKSTDTTTTTTENLTTTTDTTTTSTSPSTATAKSTDTTTTTTENLTTTTDTTTTTTTTSTSPSTATAKSTDTTRTTTENLTTTTDTTTTDSSTTATDTSTPESSTTTTDSTTTTTYTTTDSPTTTTDTTTDCSTTTTDSTARSNDNTTVPNDPTATDTTTTESSTTTTDSTTTANETTTTDATTTTNDTATTDTTTTNGASTADPTTTNDETITDTTTIIETTTTDTTTTTNDTTIPDSSTTITDGATSTNDTTTTDTTTTTNDTTTTDSSMTTTDTITTTNDTTTSDTTTATNDSTISDATTATDNTTTSDTTTVTNDSTISDATTATNHTTTSDTTAAINDSTISDATTATDNTTTSDTTTVTNDSTISDATTATNHTTTSDTTAAINDSTISDATTATDDTTTSDTTTVTDDTTTSDTTTATNDSTISDATTAINDITTSDTTTATNDTTTSDATTATNVTTTSDTTTATNDSKTMHSSTSTTDTTTTTTNDTTTTTTTTDTATTSTAITTTTTDTTTTTIDTITTTTIDTITTTTTDTIATTTTDTTTTTIDTITTTTTDTTATTTTDTTTTTNDTTTTDPTRTNDGTITDTTTINETTTTDTKTAINDALTTDTTTATNDTTTTDSSITTTDSTAINNDTTIPDSSITTTDSTTSTNDTTTSDSSTSTTDSTAMTNDTTAVTNNTTTTDSSTSTTDSTAMTNDTTAVTNDTITTDSSTTTTDSSAINNDTTAATKDSTTTDSSTAITDSAAINNDTTAATNDTITTDSSTTTTDSSAINNDTTAVTNDTITTDSSTTTTDSSAINNDTTAATKDSTTTDSSTAITDSAAINNDTTAATNDTITADSSTTTTDSSAINNDTTAATKDSATTDSSTTITDSTGINNDTSVANIDTRTTDSSTTANGSSTITNDITTTDSSTSTTDSTAMTNDTTAVTNNTTIAHSSTTATDSTATSNDTTTATNGTTTTDSSTSTSDSTRSSIDSATSAADSGTAATITTGGESTTTSTGSPTSTTDSTSTTSESTTTSIDSSTTSTDSTTTSTDSTTISADITTTSTNSATTSTSTGTTTTSTDSSTTSTGTSIASMSAETRTTTTGVGISTTIITICVCNTEGITSITSNGVTTGALMTSGFNPEIEGSSFGADTVTTLVPSITIEGTITRLTATSSSDTTTSVTTTSIGSTTTTVAATTISSTSTTTNVTTTATSSSSRSTTIITGTPTGSTTTTDTTTATAISSASTPDTTTATPTSNTSTTDIKTATPTNITSTTDTTTATASNNTSTTDITTATAINSTSTTDTTTATASNNTSTPGITTATAINSTSTTDTTTVTAPNNTSTTDTTTSTPTSNTSTTDITTATPTNITSTTDTTTATASNNTSTTDITTATAINSTSTTDTTTVMAPNNTSTTDTTTATPTSNTSTNDITTATAINSTSTTDTTTATASNNTSTTDTTTATPTSNTSTTDITTATVINSTSTTDTTRATPTNNTSPTDTTATAPNNTSTTDTTRATPTNNTSPTNTTTATPTSSTSTPGTTTATPTSNTSTTDITTATAINSTSTTDTTTATASNNTSTTDTTTATPTSNTSTTDITTATAINSTSTTDTTRATPTNNTSPTDTTATAPNNTSTTDTTRATPTNNTSPTNTTTATPTSSTSTPGITTATAINSTSTTDTTTATPTSNTSTTDITTAIAINSTSTTDTTSTANGSYSIAVMSDCFRPNITLIPSTSSLLAPLEHRRSQDFFISSYLYLDCKTSLATITKWTVSNCTANCSFSIALDQKVVTTSSELFIPAKTLDYGVYQLTLTVFMVAAPQLRSSISAYVKMTASNITANLVAYGTSMITRGYQENLFLDPGAYSIDPDATIFNASNWNYKYYCRIYGQYNFPTVGGILLTIENSTIDPNNKPCISNRTGIIGANQSALTILAYSLPSNQTYQFMVVMESRHNATLQATGYLLVQVVDIELQLIVIGCVISTLCSPNLEYQYVNPTTQVALFSVCSGTCELINNITWTVYSGVMNSSSQIVQWTPFDQMDQYRNTWFFGYNTTNFTSLNNLFLSNSSIVYWRFQVMYLFDTKSSVSSINFEINQSPQNGNCSITPLNGTTSTVFTISCQNWIDADGILDYSFYSWTTDSTQRTMLAFSSVSNINVRLPAGTNQTSLVHIIVFIRNTLYCVTQVNISSVMVIPDSEQMMNLVTALQNPGSSSITTNPLVQVLSSGNQNAISQVITSISQEINLINNQVIETAIAGGIAPSNIIVSPLGSQFQQYSSSSINSSTLIEYNKQLNIYAVVREFLINYTTDLLISTANSIILEASSLVQLTQATNQLTRTTITLASEKCYQLASALYSMASTIPYEDAQIAATQIAQCANNALNAINGPLQQRTIVLDLDSSRANTLPEDYETDLDFEWANINLFVDGNDFSLESIEKNRNLYYQKQVANQISSQTIETLSLLTSILHIQLNLGQYLCMNTSSMFMSFETTTIQSLSNKFISQIGNAQFQIPTKLQINSTNSSISLRSMVQPLAVYGNSKIQSNTNLSRSISLSLFDRFGNELSIQTNQSQPIEFIIPRDPNIVIPSMTLQNVLSLNNISHQQIFNLQFINITNSLPVSVHFEIHPLDTNLSYLFIYKFDSSPILNTSINQTDGWTIFCPINLIHNEIYTYFIDNTKTVNHQSVIFGLRELNSTEMIDFCLNFSKLDPPLTNQAFNFTSNYELRVYTSGCYYLDSNLNWQSNGLIVGSSTNHYETQCFSSHLTTFASGFIVLPSPIDWNYVFANADFDRNLTIYITLICVCTLYILFLIYARYKDKKDLEKLGVTPLPDNHASDQYFYQILVFTGHRKDAGTESKVNFILVGDQGETQVRILADPCRKILQRGAIDAFIMTVPKTLGSLDYIHIWHDNTGSGSSASWFLKYMIVRDLQTMEKVYFICQKWFAVEKGDGLIERVLPAAGECQKREFSYVLSKQAYRSITEGHLWLSIFSRPPSNKFTRVQRCTCCFVLFLTAMLLNILYYDQLAEAKTKNATGNSLALGPFYITREQISIGVIVEILSLLPSILLIQLFRRIRPRRSHQPLQQVIYLIKQQPLPEKSIELPRTKGTSLTFPWWCLYLAYGLSLIVAGISIFFTIVRGIQFGDLKTQQWLTSLLTGFFSSIFVIQPLKVISLAIFFACFCRNSNKDETADEFITDDPIDLNDDEEYLHCRQKESPFTYRFHRQINRLDKFELQWARNQRMKEIQLRTFFRELLTCLIFLSLLYFLTYSNVNSNAFNQVQHMRNLFLNTRQTNADYTKIKTTEQYWSWLTNHFTENIRAQNWYNDQLPQYLRGFIQDKTNRLIGWPIMQQIRIKSDSCRINTIIDNMFSSCYHDYSSSNEEKGTFQPEWILNQTVEISNSSIEQAFVYRTDDDNRGYVYVFRGRLEDLKSNLTELRRLNWIDQRTRTVIIQLSLYNPNSQLFISMNFLTEFLSTGGLETQARFEPISYQIFNSLSQLICLIIYMLFIIYFIIIEIQLVIQLKVNYWKNIWSLINLGIIGCSWAIIGLDIWRYRESNRISHLFAQTNGDVYINLQLSVYINQVFISLLAFCCLFATLKLIRLCRFNQRLLLFLDTLQIAFKDLLSFALMFSIVYIAFITLFYLIFVSKLRTCSSLSQTAVMLFEMILMQFDAYALSSAAPFLGPFCMSLFVFIVVFVCMSMFLTIIYQSFRLTRHQANQNENQDLQIFSFMFSKFQRWIGLKKVDDDFEKDEQIRRQYFHPIENFPNKIDQLLDGLNRIYMDQQRFSLKRNR